MAPHSIQNKKPWDAARDFHNHQCNRLLRTVSCDSFEFFPKLPIELRLEIWSIASADSPSCPRNLHRCEKCSQNQITHLVAPNSSCMPPVLFQVCREAREVAMKSYIRCYLPYPPARYFYLHPHKDFFVRYHPTSDDHMVWSLSNPDAVKNEGFMVLEKAWARCYENRLVPSIKGRMGTHNILVSSHLISRLSNRLECKGGDVCVRGAAVSARYLECVCGFWHWF